MPSDRPARALFGMPLALAIASGATGPAVADTDPATGRATAPDAASAWHRPLHAFGPRRTAAVDHAEALRRLHQARLLRERGRAPRAGEAAPDPGATGAADAYGQRQARLDRALGAAESRARETADALGRPHPRP